MKKLGLALCLLVGLAPAHAQDISPPTPPVSINAAYNAVAPTCVTTHGCWLQTDINGNLKVTGTITVDTTLLATAANQVLQITQETAVNTNLGAPGATACATDTGSCSANALLQRIAQRLTTIIAGIPVTNAGTFAVQATLAAETTKVIGTVNVAAGQTIAVTNAGTFAVQATPVAPAANTYVGNVNTQGTKATYSLTTSVPAIDGAGTLVQLQGSGTKTIRITKIETSGVLTTTSNGVIVISRCTTAVSGGTSAGVTPVAYDSTNAAVTGVVTRWTAVGTPGSCSILATRRSTWTADTLADAAPALFKFGDANGQPLVIRGTAEYMTISTQSFTSYTGASYTAYVEWTEE